jgi:phytoene desaturase
VARVVVLGAGISGLASAALLAQAGHDVTVLERHDWVGGKSRRVEVAGQRMDTGPALVTFPGVWESFVREYNSVGAPAAAAETDLHLQRLPELGEYFYRDTRTMLPVAADHEWFEAWQRFADNNADLAGPITDLLTMDPASPATLPAVRRILSRFGRHLTTQSYVEAMAWMPKELRDIIAIHTLNAGVSPKDTLALFAAMTAVMAVDGIRVPEGGVNEIPQTLARLATRAGAEIRLSERVTKVSARRVTTEAGEYSADYIVSSLDPGVLRQLMTGRAARWTKRSCSGVAIYGVLRQPLPDHVVTHSVVMPDDVNDLYAAIGAGRIPKQTMAFVNYYKAGHVYPNTKATVAVLLTAPADGKRYDIDSPWVRAEVDRVSAAIGLDRPIDELFEDHIVLDPEYFGSWGGLGGALYGATHPAWRSGPFHSPAYNNPLRPWLWRVGASVHPGGGIPAVLGGALSSTKRLLARLG